MNRSELLQISKKNYIANSVTAELLCRGGEVMLIAPVIPGDADSGCSEFVSFRNYFDDGGLHTVFYDSGGQATGRAKSAYAPGDYVYVREAYYMDGGKVCYLADFKPGGRFLREKVISARYMSKSKARMFFRVRAVKMKRLFDLNEAELKRIGLGNYERCFVFYDSMLSEKQHAIARSELNPYVYLFDVEVMRGDCDD